MQSALRQSFKAPVLFAFEYGSAAFRQKGYSSGGKRQLLDLIFVVNDPIKWHEINLRQNPQHYSLVARRFLPFGCWNAIQEYGAGLWYNVNVALNNKSRQPTNEDTLIEQNLNSQPASLPLIKYGVTSLNNFTVDLSEWKTMYLAGRLHKPIREILFNGSHEEQKLLDSCIYQNRLFALNAALRMLPETFGIQELLHTIVSLSYLGDFRMKFGENPNKIKNIVEGQYNELLSIYRPIMQSNKFVSFDEATGITRQDLAGDFTLPASFGKLIGNDLKRAIAKRVWKPAIQQSFKGLITADLTNALGYCWKKVQKQFQR